MITDLQTTWIGACKTCPECGLKHAGMTCGRCASEKESKCATMTFDAKELADAAAAVRAEVNAKELQPKGVT